MAIWMELEDIRLSEEKHRKMNSGIYKQNLEITNLTEFRGKSSQYLLEKGGEKGLKKMFKGHKVLDRWDKFKFQ